MNKNTNIEFKTFPTNVSQSKLPDSRIFKADCQIAISEALTALNVLLNKLYILENFLEDAREEVR